MNRISTERPSMGLSERVAPPLSYKPALDGLRAFAALAVVGFHAKLPGFSNGDIGVDVFFTLSGFLISSILLASVRSDFGVDYRSFYKRRALRLLPAYFVVVAVCLVADFISDAGGTVKGAAASFLYVANWPLALKDTGLGSLGHMWSLSIEEQFYLVWPVALVLVVRVFRGRLPHIIATLSALALGSWLLTLVLIAAGAPTRFVANATPTRAVQLLIGCVLAAVLVKPRRDGSLGQVLTRCLPSAGVVSMIALLAIVTRQLLHDRADAVVMWPTIAVLTCVVIVAVLFLDRGPLVRVLSARPVVAVGKVSYGLYLWHFPIFVYVDIATGLGWKGRLIGLAMTGAIVPLSYHFIEKPFLRRKNRVHTVATA